MVPLRKSVPYEQPKVAGDTAEVFRLDPGLVEWAYQLTKDLRLVQELLGHSSPTTTARYAAYDKSQTVDMVRAMDEAWKRC